MNRILVTGNAGAIQVAFLYAKGTRPFLLKLIEEHPEKEIIWIRNYNDPRLNLSAKVI